MSDIDVRTKDPCIFCSERNKQCGGSCKSSSKITNYENIKNMSIEEMAKWLAKFLKMNSKFIQMEEVYKQTLAFLQQEAE